MRTGEVGWRPGDVELPEQLGERTESAEVIGFDAGVDDGRAVVVGDAGSLRGEAGFADPGRPDQHAPCVPPARHRRRTSPSTSSRPASGRSRPSDAGSRVGSTGARRFARGSPEDGPPHRVGVGRRLDAELHSEQVAALAIGGERRSPVAGGGVGRHQPAVGDLGVRVAGDRGACRVDGRDVIAQGGRRRAQRRWARARSGTSRCRSRSTHSLSRPASSG